MSSAASGSGTSSRSLRRPLPPPPSAQSRGQRRRQAHPGAHQRGASARRPSSVLRSLIAVHGNRSSANERYGPVADHIWGLVVHEYAVPLLNVASSLSSPAARASPELF